MTDTNQNDIAATGAFIESLERIEDKRFLLRKLAEECMELAHIALKTEQFGLYEKHPEEGRNNLQRLQQEYCDLRAIIGMLEWQCGIDLMADAEPEDLERKQNKVRHYREHSLDCLKRPELWETPHQ